MKSWEKGGNTEIEMCGNSESEMCGNTMRGNVFVADKVLTHYPEIACLSRPGKQIKTEQTQQTFSSNFTIFINHLEVHNTILRDSQTQIKMVSVMKVVLRLNQT